MWEYFDSGACNMSRYMVERMLAPHSALCNSRGVARRAIVFLSPSRAGRGASAAAVCLWRVSVEWASLGWRLSKKLPARVWPPPWLCAPTGSRHRRWPRQGQLCHIRRDCLTKGREKSWWAPLDTAGPLQRALKYHPGARGVPPSWVWARCLCAHRGPLSPNCSRPACDPHSMLSLCGFPRALLVCLLAWLR